MWNVVFLERARTLDIDRLLQYNIVDIFVVV